MNSPRPIVASAPFVLSPEERELFANCFLGPQDIPIVHYLRADFFISLLDERRLLLRRADTFEDDTEEGTYPAANKIQSSHMDAQIETSLPICKDRRALIDSQMVARSLTLVHCWYEGDPSSPGMWERYGDHGRGIRIHSTTRALQESFGVPPAHLCCQVGRCTYWDEDRALPELVSCFPAFTKRRKYKDEHEIRLLARVIPDGEGRAELPPKLLPLPIDPRVMMLSVTLGPSMDDDMRGKISAAVSTHIGDGKILEHS